MIGLTAQLTDRLTCLVHAAHPELLVGCRAIEHGDELTLTPAEVAPLAGSIARVHRASGAARIVAKRLLNQLGRTGAELPRSASGAPQWPTGFVGSLAHDEQIAVAAVASANEIESVGVDVEPRLPLPLEVLSLVATPAEQKELRGDLIAARLLFCMKEAVFKATHPVDGVFLDHQDVEVCLNSLTAQTITGRRLRLYTISNPRLFALTVL